jgi:hypothetical protein
LSLTQKLVKELLDYNEEIGELIWKESTPLREKKNNVAGYTHCKGYKAISILGKDYLAHRVIWLWVYGYMPEGTVDHKDRNRLNNKL